MKFAVYMNAPISDNLRSDCLHGEWRWERQVLEALLLSDKVEQVYTFNKCWTSSKPKPLKLIDGIPASEMIDTVCLFYYTIPIAAQHNYKAMIINTHQFPAHDIELYSTFNKKYGGKWFFTSDALTNSPTKLENFTEIGCQDNFQALPIPSMPQVYDVNNFNKKIILFPSKGIIGALRYPQFNWGSDRAEGKDVFTWIAKKLAEDPEMEFHLMSSYGPADLSFLKCTDVKEEFFSFPITKILIPFKNRITIHLAMGWDQVLDLYSRTKIVISSQGAGGAPMEAAAYGIPMVAHSQTPMSYCSEYLEATLLSEKYFEFIDRLYYDEEFYLRIGSAYRNFIRQHYTYEAFVNRLIAVLAARGIS